MEIGEHQQKIIQLNRVLISSHTTYTVHAKEDPSVCEQPRVATLRTLSVRDLYYIIN